MYFKHKMIIATRQQVVYINTKDKTVCDTVGGILQCDASQAKEVQCDVSKQKQNNVSPIAPLLNNFCSFSRNNKKRQRNQLFSYCNSHMLG